MTKWKSWKPSDRTPTEPEPAASATPVSRKGPRDTAGNWKMIESAPPGVADDWKVVGGAEPAVAENWNLVEPEDAEVVSIGRPQPAATDTASPDPRPAPPPTIEPQATQASGISTVRPIAAEQREGPPPVLGTGSRAKRRGVAPAEPSLSQLAQQDPGTPPSVEPATAVATPAAPDVKKPNLDVLDMLIATLRGKADASTAVRPPAASRTPTASRAAGIDVSLADVKRVPAQARATNTRPDRDAPTPVAAAAPPFEDGSSDWEMEFESRRAPHPAASDAGALKAEVVVATVPSPEPDPNVSAVAADTQEAENASSSGAQPAPVEPAPQEVVEPPTATFEPAARSAVEPAEVDPAIRLAVEAAIRPAAQKPAVAKAERASEPVAPSSPVAAAGGPAGAREAPRDAKQRVEARTEPRAVVVGLPGAAERKPQSGPARTEAKPEPAPTEAGRLIAARPEALEAQPAAGQRLLGLPTSNETAEVEFRETHAVVGPRPPVQAAALSSNSIVAEEFRYLAAQLKTLRRDRRCLRIGIVSSTEAEGKTTVSLGLAAALAQDPACSVMLIEADVRKPKLEDYLGLAHMPGLAEWIAKGSGPANIRRVAPAGFRLLSGGKATLDNPLALGSSSMESLLVAAEQFSDFILLDCPPLTPVVDAVALQDLVHGFILVVRARHAPREALVRGAQRLRPDRILGVVLSEAREVVPRDYSYGYRRYQRAQ